MDEPKLNLIIKRALDEQKESTSKKVIIKKNRADEIYHKKISYLVSLLTPLLVAPLPDGNIIVKYPIEDEIYRAQVQDWIMQITKKHLKL